VTTRGTDGVGHETRAVKPSSSSAMVAAAMGRSSSSAIGWRVSRLDTGSVATGDIVTADIPASTTFLAPHFYANNNAVAASVILDFYRYYLSSDY
jgi:type IV secretory pathway protease TraF